MAQVTSPTSFTVDPGKLAGARIAAGKSREVVAVTIGRAYGTIAAYERGVATPPAGVLFHLARIYGVPAEALMSEVAA